MSAKPTTYQDLLDIQDRLIQQGAMKAQTAANRATALRMFLNLNKLELADPVGQEFRASFNAQCRAFVVHFTAQGKTPRNIGNSLAALRPWRKMLVSLDTDRAVAGDNLPPFNQAFRSVLKDYPVRRLGRELAIPPAMLYGWLKGKKPRLSNVAHIHRVETYFGIEQGELAILAGFDGSARVPQIVGATTVVGYRERLATQTAQHYLCKPGVDSPLRQQWQDFVRYKSEWSPTLSRSDKGVWRIAPFAFRRETEASWFTYLDGVEVPSAKIGWTKVASYLGWLALPTSEGGAELPAESTHTLAWLAVKPKVDAYIRWRVKRCGGKFNGSVFEFLAFVAGVLRQGTGYLCQQPELRVTLPDAYQAQDWDSMCRETFDLVQSVAVRQRPSRKQTRDPRDPIRHILDSENPLDFVADMVQRLRGDRPLGLSPRREAIWARDLALIKFLVSNPLRLRNIATLTWRADNLGQLYQRPDGSWWVRIEGENFKNVRGAAGKSEYDMPVQEAVWSDLERYLKVFRSRLLPCSSDFVFIAGRHGSRSRPANDPWTELSGRVVELTRKYLWRCPGIGTQAFRHLVATAIIKASNLSDFKTAALVLNDSLATVEKNYAHLRSADGANRMAELLGATLNRM